MGKKLERGMSITIKYAEEAERPALVPGAELCGGVISEVSTWDCLIDESN